MRLKLLQKNQKKILGPASRPRRPQHDERILHLPGLHLQEVGLGGHKEASSKARQSSLLAGHIPDGTEAERRWVDSR